MYRSSIEWFDGDRNECGVCGWLGLLRVVQLSEGEQAVRFPLGKFVATPGAFRYREIQSGPAPLGRRAIGRDGGGFDHDDTAEKERSLINGCRILSAYELPDHTGIWSITEADRSSTCILLCEEH